MRLYCDNHTFNKGGLGRCKQQQSKEKILQAIAKKLKDESGKYYQAAHWLDILAIGNAFGNLFAVDVFYHNKFYSGSCTHTSLENLPLKSKRLRMSLSIAFSQRLN